MGLFDLFKKQNVNITFSENSFNYMLDMSMRFLDIFSSVYKNEWYHFFISQEFQRVGQDVHGYIKLHIILGSWWDGMLTQYPDVSDFMRSNYVFNPDETDFICTNYKTGVSFGCDFPMDKVNTQVQRCLDRYEATHPGVRFEREKWGAKITKNL